MPAKNVNTLLADLRHILHSPPSTPAWEALKVRLHRSCREDGPLPDIVTDYLQENLTKHWPPQYGPLLEMWLICIAEEATEDHKRLEGGRRSAYKRLALLTPR